MERKGGDDRHPEDEARERAVAVHPFECQRENEHTEQGPVEERPEPVDDFNQRTETGSERGDRAALAESLRNLEATVKYDDGQAYHRHSRDFHMALSRPSGMLRLMHMLEAAWNITEPVQPMVHVAGSGRTVRVVHKPFLPTELLAAARKVLGDE